MRVFTHAHVSMITYRVDVYRSRPTGASLLTTSQFMVGQNVSKVVGATRTGGFLVKLRYIIDQGLGREHMPLLRYDEFGALS